MRALTQGNGGLVTALVLTLVLANLPYGDLVTWPFGLLATWFHEMGHGMMALALGARFEALVLRPDTSGFALYHHDLGRLARAMVSSAGYMGTALAGGALLTLRRWPDLDRPALLGLSGALLASGLLVVLRWPAQTFDQSFAVWHPVFGFAVVLAWSVCLGTIALKGAPALRRLTLSFIAAQTALNAFMDVRTLYFTSQRSDADTLAELLLLPAPVWATLWLLFAAACTAAGVYLGSPRAPGGARARA